MALAPWVPVVCKWAKYLAGTLPPTAPFKRAMIQIFTVWRWADKFFLVFQLQITENQWYLCIFASLMYLWCWLADRNGRRVSLCTFAWFSIGNIFGSLSASCSCLWSPAGHICLASCVLGLWSTCGCVFGSHVVFVVWAPQQCWHLILGSPKRRSVTECYFKVFTLQYKRLLWVGTNEIKVFDHYRCYVFI